MLPPLQSFSPNGKVNQQLIIVVNTTHVFVVFRDQHLENQQLYSDMHTC